MTSRHDPPRLRTMMGDLPRELSAALAEADEDFPRHDQLDDLARRMGPLLGVASIAAAVPIATLAPKAPLTLSAALKLAALKWSHVVVLPFAIGAASGAVVWQATQPSETPTRVPASIEKRSSTSTSQATAKGSHAIETTNAKEEDLPEAEDRALAAPKIATARPATHAARLDPRASVPPVPAPLAKEEPSAPPSEIELIDQAHRALAQAPNEARRWAAEHERLYPDGTFVQERETLIIEALAREGRLDEADAHAERFRARFPSSTYLQRIDSVLRTARDVSRLPKE